MEMKHKHAELIKAWADGAEIEYKRPFDLSWGSIESPSWSENVEYRIKPAHTHTIIYGEILHDGNFVFTSNFRRNFHNIKLTFYDGKLVSAEVLWENAKFLAESKPMQSLTNTETAQSTQSLKSQELYGRLETFRRDTEAREWLSRYQVKVKEIGTQKARNWWLETIQEIEIKRGRGSAITLQADMNRIKNENLPIRPNVRIW